jgi:hypothetical protein
VAIARRPVRRSTEDEEEVQPPRPARASREEDEEPRPRRARIEEDEDDEPRGSGSVRKGWEGHKANKAKSGSGDYATEFKVDSAPDLIKFLQDEPFASYRQHWVDNPPAPIKKKSWTCLEDACPLCELGDRPRLLTGFNILHLNTGGEPENKVMFLGVTAVSQIESMATDDKTGPLTRLYWAVSKSGKGQKTAYNFQPVKVRDLEEDWDIQPLEDAEIEAAEAKVYDHTVVQIPTRKQLKEIAAGLVDDDDE